MSSIFQSINLHGIAFDRLQTTPTQVNQNNFSNIGNTNIQVHPEVKRYLPALAAYIHNFVAQRAQQNVSRATHFNMMTSQNNSELLILITLVANMAYIRVKNGTMDNFDNAVSACTDWAVTHRVNFITINCPDLLNTMQDKVGEIQQLAHAYVAECNDVLQAMSQIYMGGNSNGFGGNNNNSNQNNGGGFTGGAITGFGGGGNTASNNGFGVGAVSGFGSNRSVNSAAGVIVRSNDNMAPRGDRFNNDLGMGVVDVQEKQNAPVQQNQQRTNIVDQLATGLNPAAKAAEEVKPIFNDDGELLYRNLKLSSSPWTTSRFQHHPLMFDGRNLELVRREFVLDEKLHVIDTLKKANMDRSALSLPVAAQYFGGIYPNATGTAENNTAGREEYRDASLKNAAGLIKAVRSIPVEAELIARTDELRKTGHIVFSNTMGSLPEAIAATRQAALFCADNEFGTYISEFFLAKDFVVFKDDVETIRSLSKCRTLATLIEEMKFILQNPESSHSLRVAVVQLNSYLAKSWMEWIRFYLCLDDFSGSDSFIDDALAMCDDIREFVGTPYRKLLDANQQRFIQTYLAFGEPIESTVADMVFSDENKPREERGEVVIVPILTPSLLVNTEFLASEYALVSSAELDNRDIACTFNEQSTSMGLRVLVQTMIENPRSILLQGLIRRFYINTIDNVVYEVNIGLNDTAAPLLIKKVNY